MDELQKIKVGDKIYECFVATYLSGDFNAILKTSNMEAVKTDFSNFDEIVIMSAVGLVLDKLTAYKEIKSIAELTDYYVDIDGALKPAIQIVLKQIDISDKVKEIECKINPPINESLMSLEEYKNYKISESKNALKVYLEDHPIVSTAHGGIEGIYSITEEKQNLMMQSYVTYQIEKSINPKTAKLRWNQTGEECTEFTEEEFLTLVMEIKAKVYPLVSYQQYIEKQIRNADNKEIIAAMVYSYDDALLRIKGGVNNEVS